jgi:HSP20 family protein
MTMITRWDPFREVATLQDRMNRLFNDQFGALMRDESLTGSFVPPVDVYEDENSIQLRVEIPGLEEKDIDIQLENNTLTVRGERNFEKEDKQENFHRIERRYGSFTRSFTLPGTVDPADVQADYDQGVLKIRLAKRAEAKPKQIRVNLGSKTLQGSEKQGSASAK